MKSKLVLWGSNAQDEKCLIAVSLRAADNKVDIWTFPESVATEDFYQQMMKEWRDGEGMEFPEQKTYIERDLSVTDSILPDDLKVERGDVVQRAQTEWQFVVLSSKLHRAYEQQLADLKERVGKLTSFDQPTWDNLKEFWDKVQEQVRDRNLFRDHADRLREHTNELFGNMKELRTKLDAEFERVSQEVYDKFYASLAEVERKMETGARVPVIFDELKKLQSKFRESKELTREHRNKVWEKLDGTFKAVKEKRFGTKPSGSGGGNDSSSMLQGTQRRYDGLLSAIDKMEQSIRRDRSDLEFQEHKINTTGGQLEAQLRQAKLKMIEERISSKEEKLREMNATKAELDKRLASLKEKENRRAAQEAAKEKIAGEMKAAAVAREDVAEKLDKAAEEITGAKATEAPKVEKKEESMLSAIGTLVGESLEDVADTVKAVASVISEKIEDAIEDVKEKVAEKQEAAEAAAQAEEAAADVAAGDAAAEAVAETPAEPVAPVKSDEEE